MPRKTNALWFFFALVGGGVGVWWTKRVSDDAWHAALVAAGVVIALAVYYVLNDEDAPEEEGDNVYYLGLLFTLISLVFSLVELFSADNDAVRNPEKIHALLENFGVAMTSTIAGIAGRVAVQNWQRIGSARKAESGEHTALAEVPPAGASFGDLENFNRHALGKIARELTQGANALARFHRIVRQHASETERLLRDNREAFQRESTEFRDVLQRNAEAFAQELQSKAKNTLETVGGSFGAAAKQAEALPERLRSAHDQYLAEVIETSRSFHDEIRSASDESRDALQKNFDTAAKQSMSLAQNASAAYERISKSLDSLETGLGAVSDASMAFGKSAGDAASATTNLEAEVEKLRISLAAVDAGADAIKGMLDAIGELDTRIRAGSDTEQMAASVRQIGERLETIVGQSGVAIEQAARATEVFEAFARSLRTTELESRRTIEALRVLANEAETRVETLRQHERKRRRIWPFSR